jgi:PEP-CTERM motif
MRNFLIALLGLTSATVLTIPGTVQAQTFDFDRLEFIEPRPLPANGTLFFFGDQNQNQGYAAYSNLDRNAPDAGHIGFRNDLNSRYYATGREHSPDPTGATRSASLERLTDFPNLINYLNQNGIPLSDIGYSFGQKDGVSVTQTLNLGADILGQDWFGRPGSPVEESIYRANPESFERYLTYQTTKIITFGYSDAFFASADDNPDSVFGNPNVFFSNPVSPSKVSGLDGLAAGIADALLQDVVAGGGKVQEFSLDILDPEDLGVSVNQGFEIFTFSLPIEIRIVSVPEPSSTFALMLLAGGGIVAHVKRQKRSA